MSDEDVDLLLERPEIRAIQADRFPKSVPLTGIIKNDCRIRKFREGDIVVRAGDSGSSAFLTLKGQLRVILSPPLPEKLLGRQVRQTKTFLETLAELWTNRQIPEMRDLSRYSTEHLRKSAGGNETHAFLQDVPAILDEHQTALLEEGTVFGELAALGRIPRTVSIIAEKDSDLLEIRWQGLRELRKYDVGWRRQIDELYRENALKTQLRETPIFSGISMDVIEKVAEPQR